MIDPASRTPTSAVVWIPPETIWEPIQAIRARYDRHFKRWMPHLTLLYPFRPRERFDEVEPQLRQACAALTPFEADLSAFRSFEHNPQSFTMWLATEPEASFRALQAAVQAAVPDCDDVSRYPGGYTPHLSVGQSHHPQELQGRLDLIRDDWTPKKVQVREIALITRLGENPFFVDRVIPLG